jgi:hypothetical protein
MLFQLSDFENNNIVTGFASPLRGLHEECD